MDINQPNSTNIDYIGISLISLLFLSLFYSGYLAYKSIDWTVLKRLESQQLILPPPATPSAQISTSSASPAQP